MLWSAPEREGAVRRRGRRLLDRNRLGRRLAQRWNAPAATVQEAPTRVGAPSHDAGRSTPATSLSPPKTPGATGDSVLGDTVYDPFGLHQAVAAAQQQSAFLSRLRRRLEWWLLRGLAVLPLPLLVIVSIVAVLHYPNAVATLAAVVLWIWTLGFVVHQLRLIRKRPFPARAHHAHQPGRRGQSVVVIGAGPVGLAAVKECADLGLDVECYECLEGPGGVFRYEDDREGGVWQDCTLTTSPWVTAFSDFPPQEPSSRHFHHAEYLSYLQAYIDTFQLQPYLRFGHTVTSVTLTDDDTWLVEVRDEHAGETFSRRVDRIAVCTGQNTHPKQVDLPGVETFTGEVRHVANYKRPEGLQGRRVVVVGLGESAVDVATEASEVAEATYLAIPRGKFIIPRVNPLTDGVANDYDTNRTRYASPVAIRDWFMLYKERSSLRGGRVSPEAALRAQILGQSEAGPMSQTVTKSGEFVRPLLEGRIRVRPRAVRLEGDTVVFADGTREAADVVIFAHGYEPRFPFLRLPDRAEPPHPGDLYLRMFVPELADRIAFCGFARPAIGAIPPTGELQARLFALTAAGHRVLPDAEHMRAAVQRTSRENAELYPAEDQPTVVVSWIRYLDELADAAGCRPNPWRLLADPRLFWKVATGPVTGAIYRLHGPGADPAARSTLMSLTRTHPLSELATLVGLHFWSWPLSLLHPRAVWKSHNTFV